MVPMIMGRLELTKAKMKKLEYERRTEERVKRMKSLGNIVNHIFAKERYFQVTSIIFTEQDFLKMKLPHQDPMKVKLHIGNCMLGKVLIDGGSSAYIFFGQVI